MEDDQIPGLVQKADRVVTETIKEVEKGAGPLAAKIASQKADQAPINDQFDQEFFETEQQIL